ncbi:UNVERIFIED_CONTAM: hypothetical protein HDU68_001357 [Siphonaria sp. JEL0065]|nr:hypothetical protein HDU68_001357 [Siphonaria sp. JEL0065]
MPPRKIRKTKDDSDEEDYASSEESFDSNANESVVEGDGDEVEVSDVDSEISIINCRCGNYEHPDGEVMLCCDDCDEWSHVRCVTEVDPNNLPDEWRCPLCVSRRQKSEDRKKAAAEKAEALRLRKIEEAKRVDLRSKNLAAFPQSLATNITFLDLSSNPALSTLPSSVSQLTALKTAFFSDCSFRVWPQELATCPALEMIAFRGNKMASIPENAFPANLRWLILTNNELTAIPKSIGNCSKLQKCGLAGNRLSSLPVEMQNCKKLALLRISVNQFFEFPSWLLTMPELAWLGYAGNPGAPTPTHNLPPLEEIPFHDLTIQKQLGEGASGFISQAFWTKRNPQDGSILETKSVALKVFKGAVTSDGLPSDEMASCIAAGSHPNLITAIGFLSRHPQNASGLVLPLIPASYKALGNAPSYETCTRDVYANGLSFSLEKVVTILRGIASSALHLHARGISHGDLYAHNILVDNKTGFPVIGDFGAAFIYGREHGKPQYWTEGWEKLEVLAFGHLVEDLLALIVDEKVTGTASSSTSANGDAAPVDGSAPPAANAADSTSGVVAALNELHRNCTLVNVTQRPYFYEIDRILKELKA